jgi:hypothetical protein
VYYWCTAVPVLSAVGALYLLTGVIAWGALPKEEITDSTPIA